MNIKIITFVFSFIIYLQISWIAVVVTSVYEPIVEELVDYVSNNETFAIELNRTFIEAAERQLLSPITYDDMYNFFNSCLNTAPKMANCECICPQVSMNQFIQTYTGNAITKYGTSIQWIKSWLNTWRVYLNSSNSSFVISTWTQCEEINMTQYIIPQNGFQSFNQFFIRKINMTFRPISYPSNESIIVAPCDGIITQIKYNVSALNNSIYYLKGATFNISQMLNGSMFCDKFEGGDAIQIGQHTYQYHHFHAPVSGTIVQIDEMDGWYFSDSKVTSDNEIIWSNNNRRGVVYIQNEYLGIIAIVTIGTGDVSSVNVDIKVGMNVTKGDEMGYFAFGGSLFVVLFEPNVIHTFNVKLNDLTQVGSQIAMAHQIMTQV